MWRTFFFIFLILSGIITGLVVWQWKAYSEQTGEIERHLSISQQIDVESLKSELKITQTISGLLPNKEYRLIIPDTLFQWKCKSGEGAACDSADDDPYTFFTNENKMVFTYVLPKEKKQKALLLNDWTVSIHGVEIEDSSIMVSDSIQREGVWAAGFPLRAKKELEVIDYYIFEGQGGTPSLYWQQAPLIKTAKNRFEFYSSNPLAPDLDAGNPVSLGGSSEITVVLTDEYQQSNGKGILIAETATKKEELNKMLLNQSLMQKIGDHPDIEIWLIEAFAAHLMGKRAGTAKGIMVQNELLNELGKDELLSFYQNMNTENTLSTEKLDKLLGNIKGHSTRFFTMNIRYDDSFFPLFFEGGKKVIIFGIEQTGVRLIYKNGKRLLPLKEVMEAMGYEVKVLSGDEMLLLAKGKNSYRFYFNKNVFIYNEEDYGLLENPLTILNGTAYIEIQWLKSLFGITVEEGDQKIKLIKDTK
ncbi:copper amine oxidase N-terminal domain-containing protein [Cytobacillus sp. NCCP-133]|uniref:copper amine oxidase N-terminal domain-containing protein n=1 Tax=Cytobacillus sp. NCCP-133 TaxID=766848 RepID=UPI0022319DBD|nr:copper amine oxidase N-terminal domain-containing protein [Cytobacillus sp. NCCP-133]GLB61201.1 hypothetical protein NCCP133_33310 [Cytobacillus sp. NCCP-133]